jgi:hypothetical protein
MDPKEKDYDADALLAELRESLKNINKPQQSTTSEPTEDTITFTGTGYEYGINSQDTITLTSSKYSNTITNGGYSFGGFSATGMNTNSGPYTINSGTGISNASPWYTTNTKIELHGENADIEINGKSLARAIEALEERLKILVPNPELEKEWDELKKLGNKYRTLEAKLKEQSKMWQKLKETPPPKPLY